MNAINTTLIVIMASLLCCAIVGLLALTYLKFREARKFRPALDLYSQGFAMASRASKKRICEDNPNYMEAYDIVDRKLKTEDIEKRIPLFRTPHLEDFLTPYEMSVLQESEEFDSERYVNLVISAFLESERKVPAELLAAEGVGPGHPVYEDLLSKHLLRFKKNNDKPKTTTDNV